MSPVSIGLLVIGALLLVAIAVYINHSMEQARLEKARLKADYSDRALRCERLSLQLPGQVMSPTVKGLLNQLQEHYLSKLALLDKKDPDLAQRLEALKRHSQDPSQINPKISIHSEAIAKDMRFLLEGLNAQVIHAGQLGILDKAQTQHWMKEIRHMLVSLNIELFSTLGQNALLQKQAGQARLAFERGTQYLRKLPNQEPYKKNLQLFEQQLERANAMVLQNLNTTEQASTELTDGLKALNEDEDWKKKALYD